MSIKVTCPNGHELRVKNEFAGKQGLCPHCKAQIAVPEVEPVAAASDPAAIPASQAAQPAPMAGEPAGKRPPATDRAEPKKEAAPGGGKSLRRTKVCPKCCDFVSMSHAFCPRCHTMLSDWTFPVPQESAAKSGGPSPFSVLELRKQRKVSVIRFSEHRILDELTIKKFGDELFQVADQPDCHHLLLNFADVTGLSSAMLGMLLLLRKKMSQKQGTLKLCQVGPEIMDVFNATKLGKLFEILESEQQGMKAFA